jgi:1-deoxy-D-xylulose-5-phosphate reductoisomerase
MGDNYSCALNGAGEVAVHAFLNGEIPFLAIADVLEETLAKTERMKIADYGVLEDTDARARALAREYINRYKD